MGASTDADTMTIPLEFILLPFFSVLVYWPALHGPFLFDDRDAILANEFVMSGNWKEHWRRWRGLTLTTFALQCIWPKTSRGFHLANLLIHAINGILAQRIILTIYKDEFLAILGGLLFVVLPFAVNAAGYIAGRYSVLSATFAFLGIWLILAGYPFPAICCWMWAVWAKEDGVTYAATFAAVQLWTGTPWYFAALWLLLPAVFAAVYRAHVLHQYRVVNDSAMTEGGLPGSLPQPEHGLTVLVETLAHYPVWAFGIMQAPYHGSGVRFPRNKILWFLTALAVVSQIGLFIVEPSLRLPLILIYIGPWLAYILIRMPDVLMEWRNYSSALGVTLFFVELLRNSGPWVWTPFLIYMAVNTAWQSTAWRHGKDLWGAVLNRGYGEKSRAWQELGAVHKDMNELADAEVCFRRALDLNPNLAPAMRNLAVIYTIRGQTVAAVEMLENCVARCPRSAHSWQHYGMLLEMAGRFGDAEAAYRRCLALRPKEDHAWNRLGILLFNRQAYPAAKDCFEHAVRLDPKQDYTWNRGWATRESGNLDEARTIMKDMPREVPMTSEMVAPPQMRAQMAGV